MLKEYFISKKWQHEGKTQSERPFILFLFFMFNLYLCSKLNEDNWVDEDQGVNEKINQATCISENLAREPCCKHDY